MQGYDNITLDDTAPSDNTTVPKLTGTRYTGDSRVADNYSITSSSSALNYVDNLTVALDNLTSWKVDTGSGLMNGQYYVTDNSAFTPLYTTAGWQDLDNLSLTFGSDWNGTGTLGNTSLGLKTIYVWAKDNASNVSTSGRAIPIGFDNESPVFTSFYLRDADNGTAPTDNLTNATYAFTNSDNVSIPLDNLTIVPDNGTSVAGYYFIDNTSGTANFPGPDNVTWSTDNSTLFVTFDNGTNQLKTISGYLKDTAGQISTEVTRTIGFDNHTPKITTLQFASDSFEFPTTNTSTGNLTIGIKGYDNDNVSPGNDNYSSNITHFFVASELNRPGVGVIGTPLQANDDNVSSASWTAFTSLKNGDDNSSMASDNITFDNATHEFEFSIPLANGALASTDNLTVVVWFRDNASNVSGNRTVEFKLDNTTLRSVY
jgi:hypothetical protein